MSITPPSTPQAHPPARALRTLYCGGQEPLFLAAVAFAAGILAANFVWRGPHCWLTTFVVTSIAALYLLRRSTQLAYALLLVGIASAGGFFLQAYDAGQITPPHIEAFGTGEGQVIVTGHVIREGLVRASPYGGKQESVDIETESLVSGEHKSDAHVGIRLTIFTKQFEEEAAEAGGSDSALPVYLYGQRLRLVAKLRMPRNYGNPGALDLVGYLASQGIRMTGSSRAADVEVLDGFAGSKLGLWRSRARRSALAHIQQIWPGEQGALMQAMLIGGRAFFGREIKTDFQRTGTYHILVVSGINVGILAFALFWLLRKLPFGETAATILTILLSWGYAFVADLGSPIVRATVTLNIYLLTRLLFRDRGGLNALGIAALGILAVNPRALFEASFQLTFLSVIAVAGIAAPLLRRWLLPLQAGIRNLDSRSYSTGLSIRAAAFRSDVSLVRDLLAGTVGRRLATWVVVGSVRLALGALELIFVSAVIQIALTLPMAWYFHRVTTMSLPANALVIPIASLLMPLAVLSIAGSYISMQLAYVPARITGYLLDLLTGTVRLVGHIRLSDLRVPTPTLWLCIVGAMAFAVALFFVRKRTALAWSGTVALFASAVLIAGYPGAPQVRPGVLEITALDVGQGDSLFIVTPEGKSLLLDSGGVTANSRSDFDVGEEVVAPYLWSRGVRRLDAVAISHAHSDHMGGMRAIIADFRPRELWYGYDAGSKEFLELKKTAAEYGVSLRTLHAGDSFAFGSTQFRVLNPKPGSEATERTMDDVSLVLRLQYGNTSALLVGDSHRNIEEILVAENPQADLLKIPHHGSLTSSSPEFLAAVKPQYAVVSAGFYNTFRHPRPEVMARYAGSHITTYRTDLAGAVSFYLDGQRVNARPVPR